MSDPPSNEARSPTRTGARHCRDRDCPSVRQRAGVLAPWRAPERPKPVAVRHRRVDPESETLDAARPTESRSSAARSRDATATLTGNPQRQGHVVERVEFIKQMVMLKNKADHAVSHLRSGGAVKLVGERRRRGRCVPSPVDRAVRSDGAGCSCPLPRARPPRASLRLPPRSRDRRMTSRRVRSEPNPLVSPSASTIRPPSLIAQALRLVRGGRPFSPAATWRAPPDRERRPRRDRRSWRRR